MFKNSMVVAVYLCDYKECFKWVNFIVCELYLNKTVKKMTFYLVFSKASE